MPAADRFWADAEVVLAPEDPRPGSWAGGPSAQLVDGTWWLAYRLRRPVGEGRGFANVVARSDDGVRFTPVVALGKDAFGAESLERPALVRTPDGTVAALRQLRHPGHQALAGRPARGRHRRGPRHGDAAHRAARAATRAAVKDPVIRHDGQQWHLWASVHPLDDPEATDRMTTEHATSPDGVDWTVAGHRAGRPAGQLGRARGPLRHRRARRRRARWALYDGRATAGGELGGADRSGGAATATAASPRSATRPLLQSPHAPFGLRYADRVALPDGGARWFYEATRADGAHELRTVLLAD